MKVATYVALNVEMDKQTENDGPAPGLNVETPLTDNTKQLDENDTKGLNVETEPTVNSEGPMTHDSASGEAEKECKIQPTEKGVTQEWQEEYRTPHWCNNGI